jgi:catalase
MSAVKGSIKKHGLRWHWTLIVQASTDHATVYFDDEVSQSTALHMMQLAYHDHGIPRSWRPYPYKVQEVNFIGVDNYDQVD